MGNHLQYCPCIHAGLRDPKNDEKTVAVVKQAGEMATPFYILCLRKQRYLYMTSRRYVTHITENWPLSVFPYRLDYANKIAEGVPQS